MEKKCQAFKFFNNMGRGRSPIWKRPSPTLRIPPDTLMYTALRSKEQIYFLDAFVLQNL